MPSSEFTKSLYFGCRLKIMATKGFLWINNKFQIEKGMVLIDISEIFPMIPSEFKFPIQSKVMIKE